MRDDLVESELLKNKTKKEVLDILGPPDLMADTVNFWDYDLGTSGAGFGWQFNNLIITYDNDRVTKVEKEKLWTDAHSCQQNAYCMAGFGVLITSVIFITIVTGDTLQLVALVGLTALTSAPNPATTICTNVVCRLILDNEGEETTDRNRILA